MVANESTANQLATEIPATGMEMSGPGQTPTRFDQILYRDTAVQGNTAQATAATFGVPSEKVVECRERVQEWLIENTPRTRLSVEDQRGAVEKLAIDRLEYLYCEVMEAWRESLRERGTTKMQLASPSQATTTTRRGYGQASLVLCAAKIVTTQARFQLECIDARERRAAEAAEPREHSPLGECSSIGTEQGHSPKALNATCTTTAIPQMTSRSPAMSLEALEQAAPRPAQTNHEGGGRGGVESRPRPK